MRFSLTGIHVQQPFTDCLKLHQVHISSPRWKDDHQADTGREALSGLFPAERCSEAGRGWASLQRDATGRQTDQGLFLYSSRLCNVSFLSVSSPLSGRTMNAASATPTDSNDGSSCWSEEQPSPLQLHCPPACLRPPPEHPMPLSSNLTHAPLHANNSGAVHGLQRRGVRAKVGGKKSTRGMYVPVTETLLRPGCRLLN